MNANAKMITMNTVRENVVRSVEGIPTIGYLVFWSISDVNVPHQRFQEMLTAVGLDPKLAPTVQARTALNKAMKTRTKDKSLRKFHQNVVDNDQRSAYAIVQSATVDEDNLQVEYTTETKVILDKASKIVTGSGHGLDEIKEKYDQYRDLYTSDKFRNVVLKILKHECQATAYRDRGGVYFVPVQHTGTFEKLEKLFANFPESRFDHIPVPDCAQSRKQTWAHFMGEATEALSKMKEDLAQLGPDASESMIQNRLEKFAELRNRVESYEMLLTGTATDLKAELISVTQLLKSKLV